MEWQEWLKLIVTWPYHRTYTHFIVKPGRRIIEAKDDWQLWQAVEAWRSSRQEELSFIKTASTLCAAADIGIFSWPEIPTTYWVSRGLFYTSLSLSVWAIMTAAQQSAVIATFPEIEIRDRQGLRDIARVIIRSNVFSDPDPTSREAKMRQTITAASIEFVWQCPLMLMSWAWVSFLFGLTLHVLRPFIRREKWGDNHKVAILFLATGAMLVFTITWTAASSYWTVAAVESIGKGSRLNEASVNRDKILTAEDPPYRTQMAEIPI